MFSLSAEYYDLIYAAFKDCAAEVAQVTTALLSRLLFAYDIEDHGEVRRVSEVHELGLFTMEEMMQACRDAGLEVRHDAEGLTGRGLFIARRAHR